LGEINVKVEIRVVVEINSELPSLAKDGNEM